MNKILLSAALFIAQSTATQVNQALQKIRAESAWRQEATNKFNWNATQELTWSVINAFIDVQTSPDGDVYAIQNISSELSTPQYHIYIHNTALNVWSLTNSTFQAKAVRFDRFGNIYYLSPDNCVLNSEKISLVCGVKDFEVTVDKKIYGLNDGTGIHTTDTLNGQWNIATSDTSYSYKVLAGYKGITLLKDQPIFIAENGQVDSQYGSEKLISISAGIDGSLWALQEENGVKDYQLLKWQTVAQKWYKVDGKKGINLSVYNEISVAIVDSSGLLSLSSQVGKQDEVAYTSSNPPILTREDIEWLKKSIPGKTYNRLTLLSSVMPNQKTPQEVYASFQNSSDVFVIYKSRYSKIVGAYFQEVFKRPDQNHAGNDRSIYTSASVLGVTDQITIGQNGTAYQSDELLNTAVFMEGASFHFNLDCIDPQKLPQIEGIDAGNQDYFRVVAPGYSAKILTGSPTWTKNDQVDLACVQMEFYHGEL